MTSKGTSMPSDKYEPPFHPTNRIYGLVAEIGVKVGFLSVARDQESIRLRRTNRLRSVHASLAIENNTLSLDEVTDVINGRRVIAPAKDILEVQNAFAAYGMLDALNPLSLDDLLWAHEAMMSGLVPEAGQFRRGSVGVFSGDGHLIHIAPPSALVSEHMRALFAWLGVTDLHPLIASSIFHYEFEFIHPFADGNGRMGRLWQSLILSKWQEVFAWLPVETIIRDRQQAYYEKINETTQANNAAVFVEFMLEAILDTVARNSFTDPDSDPDTDPVVRLLQALGDKECSISDLMNRLGLSHRTHFRRSYLAPALAQGLIERTIPDKPSSKHQKYRRVKK